MFRTENQFLLTVLKQENIGNWVDLLNWMFVRL